MSRSDVPLLIGAPYRPPRCRPGKPIADLLLGDRPVIAISDAPIAWPLVRSAPSTPAALPAMTDELKRAVETESVQAISYHWSVSTWTVRRWRRKLKVPRFNPGTSRLWRDLTAVRLGDHRGDGAGPKPRKLDDARRTELARRARAGESLAALAREYGVTRQYAGQLRAAGGEG